MFRKTFVLFLLGTLCWAGPQAQSLPDAYSSTNFTEICGYDGEVPALQVCHDFFQTLSNAGRSLPEFRDGKYWLQGHVQEALSLIENGDPNEIQVLNFPPGTYVLSEQVNFGAKGVETDNVIIKGAGAYHTHFEWQGYERDAFNVTGSWRGPAIPVVGKEGAQMALAAFPAGRLQAGDRLMLLSTSLDAYVEGDHTGQTARLLRQSGDSLFFPHPLRAAYDDDGASIRAINARQNIGFECFSIDGSQNPNASPQNQSAHFRFEFASNCWVKGVESSSPVFQHVVMDRASNIEVSGCYFHEASAYSGSCGGCGYGVNLQNATGECLVVDNIFRRLRHAMMLQFGANGNALAYNYSLDAAPGPDTQLDDLAFHGAWPFRNLVEGNWVEEIRFTRRREWNGEYNVVFRNRVSRRGISTANKNDFVAVVGNVTAGCVDFALPNNNNNISYDNVQEGFLCGGKHGPDGDDAGLGDSWLYAERPDWFRSGQGEWPPIGPEMGATNIPARWRWQHAVDKTAAEACHACQEIGGYTVLDPCLQTEEGVLPGHVRLQIFGGQPPYNITWLGSPGMVLEPDSAFCSFGGPGMVAASVRDANGGPPLYFEVSTGDCLQPFQLEVVEAPLDASEVFGAEVFPNPARDISYVEVNLPEAGELEVGIYDLQGRRVAQPAEAGFAEAGRYKVAIPAFQIEAGYYLCRVRFGEEVIVLKLLLR